MWRASNRPPREAQPSRTGPAHLTIKLGGNNMTRRLPAFALATLTSILGIPSAFSEDKPGEQSPPLQTVIVSGSPITSDADFLATIVDKRTREEILRSGGTSLADALADVPGVTGSGFAAGASRPVI